MQTINGDINLKCVKILMTNMLQHGVECQDEWMTTWMNERSTWTIVLDTVLESVLSLTK